MNRVTFDRNHFFRARSRSLNKKEHKTNKQNWAYVNCGRLFSRFSVICISRNKLGKGPANEIISFLRPWVLLKRASHTYYTLELILVHYFLSQHLRQWCPILFIYFTGYLLFLALVINRHRQIGNRLWRRFNLLIKLLRVLLLIIPVRAL